MAAELADMTLTYSATKAELFRYLVSEVLAGWCFGPCR